MEVTTKKIVAPELRFPEFLHSWRNELLGDICRMRAGKFVSAEEIFDINIDGLYPCYGGNGLRGYTKSYNHEGRFSLIGRQGAQCGNITIADGKFHATEHALVVNLESGFDTDWFYYLLYNSNLNQYSTGLAQPGLSVKNLESINIAIPSYPEQQKIASFLTKVDEKISQLTKKAELLEQYKKGVMQQIFKQELRFKDENGKEFPKWEKKKLGEYLKHKSTRNKNLEIELVLSVSNSKGFIAQTDQFDNHRIASKDVSNYKVVKKYDIAYNPSRINVGSIATLINYEIGIVSPMYVIFSLKKEMNLVFFENLIETHLFKHLVKVGCSGSVRDSLSFEDLSNFKMYLPCLAEQTKIANFLQSIDIKIEQVNTQLTQAKTWKKGLLQKMFV